MTEEAKVKGTKKATKKVEKKSEEVTALRVEEFTPGTGAMTQLDGDRPQAVRETVKKIVEFSSRLDVASAEFLVEIQDKKYWETYTYKDSDGKEHKYASFEDYLENEVPYGKRKAYYLIGIYKKYIVELGLTSEDLKDVEWSKLIIIESIASKENIKDLLKILPNQTVKNLKELVESITGGKPVIESAPETPKLAAPVVEKDDDSEPSKLQDLTFSLFPEQYENVKAALAVASFEADSDKSGHLLDLMSTEFLVSRAISEESDEDVNERLYAHCSRLDRLISNLKRVYRVNIEITDVLAV